MRRGGGEERALSGPGKGQQRVIAALKTRSPLRVLPENTVSFERLCLRLERWCWEGAGRSSDRIRKKKKNPQGWGGKEPDPSRERITPI